ncbi:MBL fold metallo-hydrolase RNA specificity domain-containing protein [Chitinivibrio alkaliphilus]|uniref:Putative exonuclease of the beta-lactamase fold involved in RNA processing n=1 Tax=Chitinivibrio alkaliphilus ACht1 TaxID=1313304 RepID=U7D5V6_9BACT|nr:MBL fold metallo-hydrolase [Chitinivibrio alkaliphilus]ERP30946.1 putative exonuclease of the beta-lactamase fold involved in RNA processing [Chitinivibrio alkaliphilus ACht1]
MQLGFYGAAETVTGSLYLLQVNGKNILIDCGLYQGKREDMFQKNRNFPFDPAEIDHLVVTHAHIDHTGNIPNLVRKGFSGPIHATVPTTELCEVMLRDSAYIQEKDVEFVNKIRRKQNKPPFKPIYTSKDVEDTLPLFTSYDYDETFSLGKGISVTFRDAGHILGSAGILFEINEQGKQYRLGFSGDIGRPNMPLMHDPNKLRDLTHLVMESTYGGRNHGGFENTEDEIAKIVTDVAYSGGKLIIPAFAVGRTQLLIYLLHKLYDNHRIPDIPIFVDSPMAYKATQIFIKHRDLFDRETQRIFVTDDRSIFDFKNLTFIETVDESKALNSISYPHIIISASGMAEGGRILHHLRNNVGNRKSTVLFVGYAAKHTLARKILDGDPVVKIFGIEHKVKCTVKKLDSFSAHADRHELLQYITHCSPEKLEKIYLVHGEPEQINLFKDAVQSQGYTIAIPTEGEVMEL